MTTRLGDGLTWLTSEIESQQSKRWPRIGSCGELVAISAEDHCRARRQGGGRGKYVPG